MEQRGRVLDPEEQLGYALVRAAAQISRPWLAAMRRHGINPRQFSVLAILIGEPTLSQGELARRVLVTPQSMSELIAALVEDGLLRRDNVPPGRAARLRVTSKGKALLEKAYPVVEETERKSFAALSAKERAYLGTLLRKLLAGRPGHGG
jgi:DNA-binding MarR family transcriptional regulator